MSQNQKLIETINVLKSRIIDVEKNNMKLSEADTRQGLINPIFRALGWDFSDFSSVKSELRHASYNEPVDYAFFSSKRNDKPILLLEAKAFGNNLNSPKIVKQLCSYLGEMGVQWGVLSDGNKYVMYNSKSGVSFDDQKFLTLQIKTVDTEDGLSSEEMAEKLVALLSRNCLENDVIQKTYEDHMINGQIESAFVSLLSAPFDTLANAIRREFKEERVQATEGLRITSKQIITYLESISDEEGRIPLDMSITTLNRDEQLLHVVASSGNSGQFDEAVRDERSRRVAISDLIEDELVHEGDNWKIEYKGEIFWGRITGNGQIEVNGEVYSNPSKAGSALIGRPCNGWTNWQFKDKSGLWSNIERLRQIYRENHGLQAIKRASRANDDEKSIKLKKVE
ncbi:MAG: type I restriction enzyme HsdR N-terminal domain-containing protein [Oligoflexus sp.]